MRLQLATVLLAIALLSCLFFAGCDRQASPIDAVPNPAVPESTAEKAFTFTPSPLLLNAKAEISCRSIALTYIGQGNVLVTPDGNLREPGQNANRLSARIEKGTDVLSIRVERDHLVFLTKTAFEAGVSEGSQFPLLENNPDYLKASASLSSGVATLESFVLNKRNGLAIWTRIRPAGFLGKVAPAAPDSDTMYFRCM